MSFSFKLWKLTFEFVLLDVDPTDKTLSIGLFVSW